MFLFFHIITHARVATRAVLLLRGKTRENNTTTRAQRRRRNTCPCTSQRVSPCRGRGVTNETRNRLKGTKHFGARAQTERLRTSAHIYTYDMRHARQHTGHRRIHTIPSLCQLIHDARSHAQTHTSPHACAERQSCGRRRLVPPPVALEHVCEAPRMQAPVRRHRALRARRCLHDLTREQIPRLRARPSELNHAPRICTLCAMT